MKTTAFSKSVLDGEKKFSFVKSVSEKQKVIMASKTEAILPIEMIFHNYNIAALMIAISTQRYCDEQMELSLEAAISEAALFAMTDFFETDEKKLQYLKVTLPIIRGFYKDGFRLIINPNWDNK